MKKYISLVILLFAGLFSVLSCSEQIQEEGNGYVGVVLMQDDSVDLMSDNVASAAQSTRTVTAPGPDQTFSLDFIKDGKSILKIDDHRTMEPTITLPRGDYHIEAKTPEVPLAAFNSPCYKGSADVSVFYSETSIANIVCSLINTKLTVSFSDEFLAGFDEYSLTVTSSLGGSLTYSNLDGTIHSEGYFRSGGDLTWSLQLKNKDGQSFSALSDTFVAVKPRQHYDMRFSVAPSEGPVGAGFIKVVLDGNFTIKEYDAVIDLDCHAAPAILPCEGFQPQKGMEIAVGDLNKKSYDVKSSYGLKSVYLRHKSKALVELGLPYATELVDGKSNDKLATVGVRVGALVFGGLATYIDFTELIAKLEIGSYSLEIDAYDIFNHKASETFEFNMVIDAETDMVSVTPWAQFAIVKARWYTTEKPAGLTLMYKKVADAEWITMPESKIVCHPETKTFDAELTGLEAATEYVIKAVTTAETATREVTFTTEQAGQITNFNFDTWWLDGSVWYPNADGNNPYIWDSANKAAAQFVGSKTVPEETLVISGKAAKMESSYAVIAFAAGNIYTGKFGKVSGVGAELSWGIPFTGRPIALRGYYKYISKAINRTKAPYDNMNGKPDQCQIMILLTDWDAPFQVNTNAGKFVDYEKDPNIIAAAKLQSEVTTDGYVEFCLPIEYRDNTRIPKYVVVACCSSYLGDYFTGAEGSTLWVDELTLEYDINTLSADQKVLVNYR